MIQWTEQKPDAASRDIALRDSDEAVALRVRTAPALPLICWQRTCRDQINLHLTSKAVEQGGLLLGHAWHAPDAAQSTVLVDVIESVAAVYSEGTAISLAMGPDVWQQARGRCDGAGDGRVIVGWYHSHPNLGAFFSATDRQTQAGFFNRDWHLGLCVDPVRAETAWFHGEDSVVVSNEQILLI